MLTWPANRHLITKIKAAITAGIRPCSMIFHEQPTDPWVDFDFKLLEAYQRLQDEICPKCGHPVWLCRSHSNRVAFKVRENYCAAERALKEYEYNHMSRDEKKNVDKKARAAWGRFYSTEPFVPPNMGDDLPTRQEWYEEMSEKAKTL